MLEKYHKLQRKLCQNIMRKQIYPLFNTIKNKYCNFRQDKHKISVTQQLDTLNSRNHNYKT